MTVQELRELLSYAGAFGVGGLVAGVSVWLILKSFGITYLSKKGENLATKEDIAAITNEIEGVKMQYTLLIESSKAKHQLRMAALDRRLEAHQEAFTLWREVYGAVHTDEIRNIVPKCQSWWEQNCVYLEPRVRDAFVDAYSSALSHGGYVRNRADIEIVSDNWGRIIKFPNILFEAVQLPPLTETEKSALLANKSVDSR